MAGPRRSGGPGGGCRSRSRTRLLARFDHIGPALAIITTGTSRPIPSGIRPINRYSPARGAGTLLHAAGRGAIQAGSVVNGSLDRCFRLRRKPVKKTLEDLEALRQHPLGCGIGHSQGPELVVAVADRAGQAGRMKPVAGRGQTPELVDTRTEPRHGKIIVEVRG